MKTIITVEILESGQSRPHADSRCRARIKAERSNIRKIKGVLTRIFVPKSLTEDEVRQLTRMLVHDYKDEPQWFETRLQAIKMIEEGLWEVLLIKPYTG